VMRPDNVADTWATTGSEKRQGPKSTASQRQRWRNDIVPSKRSQEVTGRCPVARSSKAKVGVRTPTGC